MFSFYIIFTINAHLIEHETAGSLFSAKHRDSKQWNLHKHFTRLYLVFW